MDWLDKILRRGPMPIGQNKGELDVIQEESEKLRCGVEHESDQLRAKLREIAEAPDPILALVQALRGVETSHVRRRSH